MDTAEAVVFPTDAHREDMAIKFGTAAAIGEALGKNVAHVESLRDHIAEVSQHEVWKYCFC